jgi:lysophospholipase L1-like esterase
MGIKRLVEIVKTHPFGVHATPKVLIVSPPLTVATAHADLKPMFQLGAEEAPKFAGHYARIAQDTGSGFFDAAKVAMATPLDGVHLDAANTRAIGEGLVPLVAATLGL